ncbi:MAG: hypothetical protein ACC652_06445 [Acidimicrobiales bacterium]
MTNSDSATHDLARRVGSLEAKFDLLRGIVDRRDSDNSGIPDVYWRDFPESERWKVAWGTWWRMSVASLILYIAIVLLAVAVLSLNSL